MAELTKTIDSVNRGKSIIDGDKSAKGSFIGGLADLAKGTASVFNSVNQDLAQGAAAKRVAAEDAFKAGERSAANDTATALMDFQMQSPVPKSIDAGGQEVAAAANAVAQGRMSPTAFNLNFEAVYTRLKREHPDHVDAIVETLKKYGGDNYIARDFKTSVAADDAERAALVKTNTTYYDAAVKNGVADPNNFEESVKRGGEILQSEARLAQLKTQQEITKSRFDINDSDRKWELDQNGNKAINEILTQTGVRAASLYGTLTNLATSAGEDPTKRGEIEKLAPQLSQLIATSRQQALATARAHNLEPDKIAMINTEFDTYEKGFTQFFTGDMSNYQTNKRALDNAKTAYGLDNAKAFKAWSQIASVLGSTGAANAVLGGDLSTALSPEVREAAKRELQGLGTIGDEHTFSVHVANLTQLLRGNTNLQALSPEKARQQIPSLMGVVSNEQQAILKDPGKVNPVSVENWSNGYSNLAMAAVDSLNPATSTSASVWEANRNLFNPGARAVIDALAAKPETAERARAIAIASRGAAAHSLEVAKSVPVGAVTPYYSVQFKNGQYFAQFDEKAYNKANGSKSARPTQRPEMMFGEADSQLASDIPRTVPKDMQQNIDARNAALNHLVETAKYDTELPKGVTPGSLREHYATGSTLKNAQGKPVLEEGATFNDTLNQFRKSISDTTLQTQQGAINPPSFKGASISPGNAVSRLTSRNVPSVVAQGIVGNLMHESGLKTGAVGDGGQALSLAQWHPDRQKKARLDGFDLSDPNDAIDFVLHELNTTEGTAKAKLAGAKTAEEAADIFALYFLRPQGAETKDANKILGMSSRRANATKLAASG